MRLDVNQRTVEVPCDCAEPCGWKHSAVKGGQRFYWNGVRVPRRLGRALVRRVVADLYQECPCYDGSGTVPVPCPDQADYPKNTSCCVAHFGPCSHCGGKGHDA